MNVEDVKIDPSYTFWTVPAMKVSILLDCWKLDSKVWPLIGMFRHFQISGNMVSKEIEGNIYYWFCHSYILNYLFMHGIHTRQKMSLLMQSLVEEGFFLYKDEYEGMSRRAYYAPTQKYFDLFNIDNITKNVPEEDNSKPDEEPVAPSKKEETPYEYSPKFAEFRSKLLSISDRFKHHGEPIKANGTHLKLWEKADQYMVALLDGSFMDRFGSRLKHKYENIPLFTVDEVANLCDKCFVASDKASIDQVFVDHAGRSPVLDYYFKSVPQVVTYSPEKVAKWKENYPYLFSTTEKSTSNLSYYVGKVKGLTRDNPHVYALHDKIQKAFDEDDIENFNKINRKPMNRTSTRAWTKYYIEMVYERNKYKSNKGKVLEDWTNETIVGRLDKGNWFLFAMWMHEKHKQWIVHDKAIQKKILEAEERHKSFVEY